MNRHRKGLMIILDGVGDLPSPQLDGKTPLEAARTPNLDDWVRRGLCGMVDPLTAGMPVDTHTGTAMLMGLAPGDALRLTRGPVEALGVGTALVPGDVAIRANFATLEADASGLRILDRRAGRIREGTDQLAAALGEVELGHGMTGSLIPGTQHRAVVRIKGTDISGDISDTDPGSRTETPRVQLSEPLGPSNPLAARTAQALNLLIRKAHEVLQDHPVNRRRLETGLLPANGVITRGAGKLHECHSLVRYLGINAAIVTGEKTITGLGRLFGFQVSSRPGFTALADTDLDGKMDAVSQTLQSHDLVFLHIKATDVCAHDRNPLGKRDFLQRIDAALAGLRLPEHCVVAVSGDHSTDSNVGAHTGDPVPSILCIPGGRHDAVAEYGESACMSGGLGRIPASGLFIHLLDAMGWLHNYHPTDRDYLECR